MTDTTGDFLTSSQTGSEAGLPVKDPTAPPLEVKDLQVEFHTRDGVANAVNGVSFHVDARRDPRDPR